LILRAIATVKPGGANQSPRRPGRTGRNAIVLVWDENDYGSEPNQASRCRYQLRKAGLTSQSLQPLSLLKTIEAAFNLPYLNHAADKNVPLMKDLFAR